MSSSKIRPRLSSKGVLFPLDYVYARSGVGVPEAEVIEPDTIPQPYRKLLVHKSDMTLTLERHFGGRVALRPLAIFSTDVWYFRRVLPLIGRMISGHTGAYSYLPASVGTFPPPAEFMTILRQAGFADVRAVPLTFGIVYLYTAVKA